ncbi:MAG: GNAT family N-acetyltransferase [Planctomycetes bacterium]|nr:GNAT family N-acetyltransferase [Planctomycetota bacterium]
MSAQADAAVTVRAARPADVATICRFIAGLAAYERLEHQLDLDEARLHEHLFGQQPVCGALIAESGGLPIGFALYFATYSTFRTRPCMHLEDLFVEPEHRGKGAGLALLRAVADEARARGCPRLDWNVLDWNTSAIEFYEQQGAQLLPDWRVCRLEL